jgi:hypothetical protein
MVQGGIHRWYRGIIESFYLSGTNEIYDLIISKKICDMANIFSNKTFFISNFKNENFYFFSSQIFWAYINFFHFPLVVWPFFFKFQFKFQN